MSRKGIAPVRTFIVAPVEDKLAGIGWNRGRFTGWPDECFDPELHGQNAENIEGANTLLHRTRRQ
jgi:hypothetical protein